MSPVSLQAVFQAVGIELIVQVRSAIQVISGYFLSCFLHWAQLSPMDTNYDALPRRQTLSFLCPEDFGQKNDIQ
jgi:hypothetical protein